MKLWPLMRPSGPVMLFADPVAGRELTQRIAVTRARENYRNEFGSRPGHRSGSGGEKQTEGMRGGC